MYSIIKLLQIPFLGNDTPFLTIIHLSLRKNIFSQHQAEFINIAYTKSVCVVDQYPYPFANRSGRLLLNFFL